MLENMMMALSASLNTPDFSKKPQPVLAEDTANSGLAPAAPLHCLSEIRILREIL